MKTILVALVAVLALLWTTAEAKQSPEPYPFGSTYPAGRVRPDAESSVTQHVSTRTSWGAGNYQEYVLLGSVQDLYYTGTDQHPNIAKIAFKAPDSNGDLQTYCEWIGWPDQFRVGNRAGGLELWCLSRDQWTIMAEFAGESFIQFNGHGKHWLDFRYKADNAAYNWRVNWFYDASMAQMILTRQPLIYTPEAAGCPFAAQLCVKGGDILTDGYVTLGQVAGAPPTADCDAVLERGRMKVDPAAGLLYVCMNSGWVAK